MGEECNLIKLRLALAKIDWEYVHAIKLCQHKEEILRIIVPARRKTKDNDYRKPWLPRELEGWIKIK